MIREGCHLNDERLLMDLEGELAAREHEMVRSHLDACWECRARRQEIEQAITVFIRIHLRDFDCKLPPVAGRRALLRAQLAQLAEPSGWAGWFYIKGLSKRGLTIGVGCLALWALFAPRLVERLRSDHQPSTEVYLPDSRLTPGVATLAGRQTVCAQENIKNKAVSAALQRQVFAEYGIAHAGPQAYEVDYLVTPALGGSDDVRNLWPHSYGATWNAHVKDDLEDLLRSMVCDGTLDLGEAQHEIAQNWIAAYKKYFHTDQPLGER